MKPSAVLSVNRHVLRPRVSTPSAYRPTLEPLEKLEASLYESLTRRKTKTQWDGLDINVAETLSKTLEKYLQKTVQLSRPHSRSNASPIPPGFHQVYFNLALQETHILPDGTDRVHSPGYPFEKRLWGGGSLIFNPVEKWFLKNGYLGLLQEDVENVQVKGKEGAEKIFVTVSRKAAMGHALGYIKRTATQLNPPSLRTLDGTDLKEGRLGKLAFEEKKTLVFMRTKTEEELKQSLEAEPRIIRAPYEPDFQQALTPTAHLLFRFSALTFNAHRIHLDRQYAREVEGHRNLLVHGPLTQVLMLQVLKSQLNHEKKEMIYRFDYRNLAPLYADEKMKICTRRRPESPNKFDVWIEGHGGGLAVKATAEVGPELDDSDPGLEEQHTPVNSLDMKSNSTPNLERRHSPVDSSVAKSDRSWSPKQSYTPVKSSGLKSKSNPSLKDRHTPIHYFEMKSIVKQMSDPEPKPSPMRQFEMKSTLSHEVPKRTSEPAPHSPPEPRNDAEYLSNPKNDAQAVKEEDVKNAYGYTATEIAELNKRKYSKDADQDERFRW